MGYPTWGGIPSANNGSSSLIAASNYSSLFDLATAVNACTTNEVTVDFTGVSSLTVQQSTATTVSNITFNKVVNFINAHDTTIYSSAAGTTVSTTATWTTNTNFTKTGSFTKGSTIISLADTSGIAIGMGVYGSNIRAGTYVTAISPNTSVTITSPTFEAQTNISVNFQGNIVTLASTTGVSVGSLLNGQYLLDNPVQYMQGSVVSLQFNPGFSSGTNIPVSITGAGNYAADWVLGTTYSKGQRVRYTDNRIYTANNAMSGSIAFSVGTGANQWTRESGTITFSKRVYLEGVKFYTGDQIILNGAQSVVKGCTFSDCQLICLGAWTLVDNNIFNLFQHKGVFGSAYLNNPDSYPTWNSGSAYTSAQVVIAPDNSKYQATRAVTAGILLTDTSYWNRLDSPACLSIQSASTVSNNNFYIHGDQKGMQAIRLIILGDLTVIKNNNFTNPTCPSHSDRGLLAVIGNTHSDVMSCNSLKIDGNYINSAYQLYCIGLMGTGVKWYCHITDNYYEGFVLYPAMPSDTTCIYLRNFRGSQISGNRLLNVSAAALTLTTGGVCTSIISNTLMCNSRLNANSSNAVQLIDCQDVKFSSNYIWVYLPVSPTSATGIFTGSDCKRIHLTHNSIGIDPTGNTSVSTGAYLRGDYFYLDANAYINSSTMTTVNNGLTNTTSTANAALNW